MKLCSLTKEPKLSSTRLYNLSDLLPSRTVSEFVMQRDGPSPHKSLWAPEILTWQACSGQKSLCCSLCPERLAELRVLARVAEQQTKAVSGTFPPRAQIQGLKIDSLQFLCFLKIVHYDNESLPNPEKTVFLTSLGSCPKGPAHFN